MAANETCREAFGAKSGWGRLPQSFILDLDWGIERIRKLLSDPRDQFLLMGSWGRLFQACRRLGK